MEIVAANYDYQKSLLALYHLIINADGELTEKEIKMGELMRDHEEIDRTFYDTYLNSISEKPAEKIYDDCIGSLKKCSYEDKARCIAWLSNIANADGFMDKKEWELIYHLYSKELNVDLNDIMSVQKTLPRGLFGALK
jgi:uncharacterized tellurite resistance protein B-like protein